MTYDIVHKFPAVLLCCPWKVFIFTCIELQILVSRQWSNHTISLQPAHGRVDLYCRCINLPQIYGRVIGEYVHSRKCNVEARSCVDPQYVDADVVVC